MIGLYDLVKARLVEPGRCPALLQVEVGMNAEAAADMIALGADVSALVTPLSDRPGRINAVSLRVTRTDHEVFGVTMALVYPGGFEQFEPAREQIKTALQGWLAPGLSSAIEYAGGQQLSYSLRNDGGRWLHLLRFEAATQTTYGVST